MSLLSLVSSPQDGAVSVTSSRFNGVKWESKLKVLSDCQLDHVSLIRVTPAQNVIVLASSCGDIQLYNARTLKARSGLIRLNIHQVRDLQFTEDQAFMIVAFVTGQVNVYCQADGSYGYVSQI